MSKVNQIQNKLKELDSTTFQKLCDAYIVVKGYGPINPLGSVTGADKVAKGTPDTWIRRPDDTFDFAEYTTHKRGVYKKLQSDLEKCFDITKTGLATGQIHEIVLCHTSVLKPDEENGLADICKQNGSLLRVFGIGQISFDLYENYPGLARDFLGIEVDTGQVVSAEQFVTAYNKRLLATPLDTPFQFRDNEIAKVLQALETVDLVIVTGNPGVGKSRLSIECCERFVREHPEVKLRCIFNRGADLFEDLRVHFLPPGSYLLFADDANHANRFGYVLDLLHNQRADRRIKVIATVRDYALSTIRDAARNHKHHEVEVEQLKDEQIKLMVQGAFDVQFHHIMLDRIANLAQGNPRIAMMAANIAVRANTLESIHDVSMLYDEYFQSIWRDLEELGTETMLKVASIVAFFGAVDRTNSNVMQLVCAIGHFSPEVFWQSAERLHTLEVLDMHDRDVVKTSNQVLATYVVYRTVFKDRILGFRELLEQCFPRYQRRFVDILNPILSAFDGEALAGFMRPSVLGIWTNMQATAGGEAIFALLSVFWFTMRTETLAYIKERILLMEGKPAPSEERVFKPNPNLRHQSLLSLIQLFSHSNSVECGIAIELTLDYVAKRPAEVNQALHVLTGPFGFQHDSYLRLYEVPQYVVSALWSRTRDGDDEMYSRLFLAVSAAYLQTHFDSTGTARGNAISIIFFDLTASPELLSTRQTIWRHVRQLFGKGHLRSIVIDLLHHYCQGGYRTKDPDIIESDMAELVPFIKADLDPLDFTHCTVVHEYLALLCFSKVAVPEQLVLQFTNETYVLSEILLPDDRRLLRELSYEQREIIRLKRLAEYFTGFGREDYVRFIDQCMTIRAETLGSRSGDQLAIRVSQVLVLLADRDGLLFREVVTSYLNAGTCLNVEPGDVVFKLIETCGPDQVYEILAFNNHPQKIRWLFAFYLVLPTEHMREYHLEQLYMLYRETDPANLTGGWNHLLKYRELEPDILVRVTEIVLQRVQQDKGFEFWLWGLCSGFTVNTSHIIDGFRNGLPVLKRAYCIAQQSGRHSDHDSELFRAILTLDSTFAREYVESTYQGTDEQVRGDDIRDYEFVWLRDDYQEIMDGVLESAFTHERDRARYLESHTEAFLRRHGPDADAREESVQRKRTFLCRWIENRCTDMEFIGWLFGIIMRTFPDQRASYIQCFVQHNDRFEDFKSLPLEPSGWSTSRTWVPVIQKRIDAFTAVLPFLNSLALLDHRLHVQREIDDLQAEMEREKKRDFVGH